MTILKNYWILTCLIATGVISIATSKQTYNLDDLTFSNYGAASNCPNATVTNQAITVSSAGIITNPAGMDFLSLGLPVTNLVIPTQTPLTGTVNSANRTCTYSVNTTNGTLHIYSCSDNNVLICQVTFTQL